ncbi:MULTISPECIES: PIG-L deacetylase family protein [unclassified Yoonia]|uniref:PIG-L deacetylase family protein n=1 Tax=unclassified Yoonia TaxID=2629118 RepID=UPI002AFEDCC6|nr:MULTISPECIES: PIG-L deacetylase family protein [unclassified Yoonia]
MGSVHDFVWGSPVLVLAPHPDDEVLGCGALLADCWREGIPAHVACLTDGAASHPRSTEDVAAIRAKELADAITILGGDPEANLTCLGYPDAALHHVPLDTVVSRLDVLIGKTDARILFAPSPLDPHCDHVTAALIATNLLSRRPHLRLIYYPIWSRWVGAGMAPAVLNCRRTFYPVNAGLKSRAIAAHASQQGKVFHDDPNGFAMPPGFARLFAENPEIYDERII